MTTSTASTDTQTIITLQGSVEIVSEFFFTAINSILYQRGIYQPETFRRQEKYGLTVLTTTDEGLLGYLDRVMKQLNQWLLSGDVQKLVVVVAGIDSGETLERWQFNVDVDGTTEGAPDSLGDENKPLNAQSTVKTSSRNDNKKKTKPLTEIHNEIQAIIRQITASVS
jgi:mitotic spindle assembly checkpoint protein MAD2